MIRNLQPIWIMLLNIFFCNIIKVNQFLHCFVILMHLVYSFLLTRSLLIAYVYVSIESVYFILLLSSELRVTLLISSVRTLCLALINLHVSLILLVFLGILYDSFQDYLINFIFVQMIHFLFKLSCFQTVFINLKFKFFFI